MLHRPSTAARTALAGGVLVALLAASAVLTSREAASGASLQPGTGTAHPFVSNWPGADADTSVPSAASVEFPEPVGPPAPTF